MTDKTFSYGPVLIAAALFIAVAGCENPGGINALLTGNVLETSGVSAESHPPSDNAPPP